MESLSPHRVLAFAGDPALADGPPMVQQPRSEYSAQPDFATLIFDNLRTAGVQQAHTEDRIVFASLIGWPGEYICAEGRYLWKAKANAPASGARAS